MKKDNRLDVFLKPVPTKHLQTLTGGMPKILTLDIETAPMTVYSWGLFDQNHSISQIVDHGRMLCFAAKWYGEKKVMFYSEHHNTRKQMIREAWRLIDEADIVVGYNHKSFDMKWLNREFILEGLTPPSPVKTCDLLMVARGMFKFPSNKLDYVAQALGLGSKVKHTGQELWNKVLEGDDKAWNLMKKYNIGDVQLTEALFDYLGPWIKSTQFPHIGLWTGERCCYRCGSTSLKHAGFHHTAVSAYARFQCGDCGAWNRLTHVKDRTITRAI